jgi:NTE family protein
MSGARDHGLAARLAQSEFFGGLDPHVIARLIADASLRRLEGGELLFRAGDPARFMGYVVAGCLGVFPSAEAIGKPIGRIAAGETVGEMGLISGRPRSATVVALRDTELLEFPRASFERLIDTHPRALLVMARTLIHRLEAPSARERRGKIHTLALLPLGALDASPFAERLAGALRRHASARVVGRAEGGRPTGWYSELEREHRFVLYRGEPGAEAWNAFCERQADLVLLLASAEDFPARLPAPVAGLWRPRWLLVEHPAHGQRRGLIAAPILQAVERVLHHVEEADLARTARLLADRALGLVCSGGGARGFAHVGMLKALLEAGLEPDLVGGTSIGAVVAAGWAAGWSIGEMEDRFRRAFVQSNPLGDYTVPFVAFSRGRRVSDRLREHFGDWRIEDLRRPFYCVATGLGAGGARVFASGTLWTALRASIAIPGLLPPVFADGDVLVDGGVVDNLPVKPMRAFAPGRIVGFEVAGGFRLRSAWDETELPALPRMVWEWFRGKRRHDIARILLRAGMVNSEASLASARAELDLHLKPPLDGVDLLDWRRFDEIVEAGYRFARASLASASAER